MAISLTAELWSVGTVPRFLVQGDLAAALIIGTVPPRGPIAPTPDTGGLDPAVLFRGSFLRAPCGASAEIPAEVP